MTRLAISTSPWISVALCATALASCLLVHGCKKAQAVSPTDMVYVTPAGKCYHRKDCDTLAKSRTINELTLEQAKASGRRACSVCEP